MLAVNSVCSVVFQVLWSEPKLLFVVVVVGPAYYDSSLPHIRRSIRILLVACSECPVA